MSQHWLFTRTAFYRSLPLLTSLLLTSFLAGCHSQATENSAPNQPTVSITLAQEQQVIQWDEFNGRIEAAETVALQPRVSGHIEKINYREGQTVMRNDVLFEIDARSYRAALTRAKADLASAQANALLARSKAARAQKLVALKAVSKEELEQRRAASAQADASVQFAQAAVDTAKLELEFTQVRAPISGQAGRALVTTGNLVSPGETANILTTLVSQDPIHVHFDIDERTYLRYAQIVRTGERPDERNGGVPVHIGLLGEDGYPHTGHADFIDNHVNPDTGTIRVRATLPNSDGLLTPGLYARVRLQGSKSFRAILIDDKAIMTDQDRKYVYVVDENDTAKRRDISLGRLTGGMRIVESGLQQGDRIIINGIQKITHSGMPVRVQTALIESQHIALQSTGNDRE